jgi:hypothetical protein
VRELRNRLQLTVFVDFERVARDVRDQAAVAIGHGGRDAGQLDAGTKQPLVAQWLRGLGEEAHRGQGGGEGDRKPTREHGYMLTET